MPISVRADVVDLTKDAPKETDVFFVDSNVWYWVGYTNASLSSKYNQSNDYPNYINQALDAGSQLYKCTLSFAELAHSIERSEREIFNAARKKEGKARVRSKDFRHNYSVERSKVVDEIENTWRLADALTAGLTVEVNLTSETISDSLSRIKNEALDGYDVFMVEALLAKGIRNVITDDGDFGQVTGIIVFTANTLMINAARLQGKLVTR